MESIVKDTMGLEDYIFGPRLSVPDDLVDDVDDGDGVLDDLSAAADDLSLVRLSLGVNEMFDMLRVVGGLLRDGGRDVNALEDFLAKVDSYVISVSCDLIRRLV